MHHLSPQENVPQTKKSQIAKRALFIMLALASVVLVIAGCGNAKSEKVDAEPANGSAKTISVEHAQGATDVPVAPKNVFVFDMAALDTIDTIGVAAAITGAPVESLPNYVSVKGDDLTNAGTLFEPDYEKVAAAKPDLIIIGGRSAEAYKELNKIAPTIDLTVDAKDFIGSVKKNAQTLGEIFDAKDAADANIKKLDDKISTVKDKASDAGTALFIMTSGGKLSAFGTGSRFGLIHDDFGLKSAKEDIKVDGRHGEAASFEYVLAANPDHLFVIDRDSVVSEPGVEAGPAAEKLLDNPLVNKTSAAKKENIHYLDATSWYIVGGGLTSFQKMVDEVGAAIGV